ncbi:MAG: sugar phosphate isomerase/epimerase [Clostridia bacterium]|nr:sugar phosphate isomerase/epimerase [Clostridia bacterium]
MKIGTMVHFNSLEETRSSFEKLRAFGFDNCQLCAWKPEVWTDENAVALRALMDEYGVTASCFWCGWEGPKEWNFYGGQKTLGLVPEEYREMRVKNLCDGSDFAKKLGISEVATHMGYIPENPYDPNFKPLCDAIRVVAEHMKQNGQWLLFETGQETPVTLLRCFEEVGTGNLAVNLDTANLILYGKANPVDALDVIGPYVRNLHAKDGVYPTNGKELGKETRLGDGKVDFRALFEKLHQLGYDSWVTIEREISGEQQDADIRYATDYLQNIINEVYGG